MRLKIKDSRQDQTETLSLFKLLKKRVWDMNIVNFFIAGSGRKGNVSEENVLDDVRSLISIMINKNKRVIKRLKKRM